jgi:hypothetical protein
LFREKARSEQEVLRCSTDLSSKNGEMMDINGAIQRQWGCSATMISTKGIFIRKNTLKRE